MIYSLDLLKDWWVLISEKTYAHAETVTLDTDMLSSFEKRGLHTHKWIFEKDFLDYPHQQHNE